MSSVCFHCNEPLAAISRVDATIDGVDRAFCCEGCLAVASTISEGGLSAFYQYRKEANDKADESVTESYWAYFDSKDFVEQHIKRTDDFNEVTLLLGGMHCTGCTWLIEHYLQSLDGIERVVVNLTDQTLWIRWDPAVIGLSHIARKIHGIGFHAESFAQNKRNDLQANEYHQSLRRLGVAGIAMMQVGMMAIGLYAGDFSYIEDAHRDLLRLASLLFASVVMVYCANPFFINAWRGVRLGRPGMDLPVAIALLIAYSVSVYSTIAQSGEVYFDTVVMFTFLLSLSRFLEMRARHFSNHAKGNNVDQLLPETVLRLNEQGQFVISPRRQLAIGDKVLVKAGETLPVDATGDSLMMMDESQLTGEFKPVEKRRGDILLAGSINVGEPIVVEAICESHQLSLYKIAELLDDAKQVKPDMALLADTIAKHFVLAVLLLSSLTYFIWHVIDPEKALWITLSVLVVSCPCALSLATPTVITSATQRLRQFGLLVTQANSWETINKLTHVIFDKTGTLTAGKLEVAHCYPLGNVDQSSCFALAASLERFSEHPIAQAFQSTIATYQVHRLKVEVSAGIEGEIDGITYRLGASDYCASLINQLPPPMPSESCQWILLASEQGPLCWFGLSDVVRPGAESLIESLSSSGLQLEMLSGDSSGSAESLAEQLGISVCISGQSAEDKLAYIQSLQRQGSRVLMIGDGINDIPVLAAADVSIAMANATDLAKTQADIILLSSKLTAVHTLFEMSQSAHNTIRQNLLWALIYNFTSIPMAMMGLVPPYLAAIGMSLSSLLVVINALRLYRWQAVNIDNVSSEYSEMDRSVEQTQLKLVSEVN